MRFGGDEVGSNKRLDFGEISVNFYVWKLFTEIVSDFNSFCPKTLNNKWKCMAWDNFFEKCSHFDMYIFVKKCLFS